MFVGITIVLWKWTERQNHISSVEQSLTKHLVSADISGSYLPRKLAALTFKKNEIAHHLDDLEEKLHTTNVQLDNNSDLKILSAIEGLIVTADRNLQTRGNVHSALDLLKYSQELLQSSDMADFSKLNEVLIKHIKLLESQDDTDILLINQSIINLSEQIDDLPVKADDSLLTMELPEKESILEPRIWYRYFLEIKQDIHQLIKIERMDETQAPLLFSSQARLLKENVKLLLMQARLALLMRDENNFYSAIKTVENWLQAYFNTKDLTVKNTLADIKKYLNTEIELQLPNLEEVLEIVYHDQFMLEGGR